MERFRIALSLARNDKFHDTKKNGLFFMEVRKQKSGEERIKEQSTSETVCFAWGNLFCSFQRHKNKPSLFCFFFGRCKKEKRVILSKA
jgi:hypothetical protein